MSEQSTALAKSPGPVSTPTGLAAAPNQQQGLATFVPLDRENLTFFANMVKGAGLVPKATNDTNTDVQFNRVMAKIVAGTSYGFDPMLSQTCFHVMFGGMTLSAQGHEILFRRSGEYDIRIEKLDDNGCKVKVLRKNEEGKWLAIGEVEFTREMAENAELTKNKMYATFGPDMFFARVMTRVVKRFNPGCLQPTVILGNHFARESQQGFNSVPPAPTPPQIPEVTTETPTTTSEQVDVEVEVIETEASYVDDGDGEVTEYTEPKESEPIDTEESKREDLLTAAKELYSELKGAAKKKADEAIGVGKVLTDLTNDELAEFLDTQLA